ncbi:phage regulatory CII family protein [Microvirga antarctica]|uniref:phage regulatory CII family protein n=1 Tax=Microvirga antarctica TaxID=2819233 RepID=UPI001B30F10D|nr:phage regulatory CII family protein [Microvirga antarctica]
MSRNPYSALKAAFDADVDRLGGVVAVANRTRVGPALISRYGSISDQNITTHVPADVLLDVTMEIARRGGEPETLRLLADLAGFKLVPREAAESNEQNLMRHVVDTTRAQANLASTVADALEDGKIDDAEQLAIDVAAAIVETEAAELRNDMKRGGNVSPLRTKLS